MSQPEKCPRCGGREFHEHDKDADSWDDDITYTSYACLGCGLWYDGWNERWLIGCNSLWDEDDAEEFKGDPQHE